MNMQELLLVSHRNLNVKCFVFNNNTLGLIRYLQNMYYNGNYYGTNPEYFNCVNLELLSKAYNIDYVKVISHNQSDEIRQALASTRPCIIDLAIHPDTKLLNRFQEVDVFDKERING